MVIGESKPLAEILDMVKDFQKIVVAGCNGCVTICCAGGEKEVAILSSELRIARRASGNALEVKEHTCERQCDPEFIEGLDNLVEDVDAVVSIACSVGPQYIVARYPHLKVFPGLNTTSIGGAVQPGVWTEFCQACGDCIIHHFGGLCPITRCAKQLLNGPCGGSSQGLCEVGHGTIPCVWQQIYDRMKILGELHKLTEVHLYKNWSTSRDGGLRTTIREELKQ